MSQRESGYQRRERDCYETPSWVTRALLPHLRRPVGTVWEPACGSGKMSDVFIVEGFRVVASDIHETGDDFLKDKPNPYINAIITNPPYQLAQAFCEHALGLMQTACGQVAMLLRTDFDHAVSRSHLFGGCPWFAKKLVLTKRIAWFVEADGKPKASPSFNHAWYIWDWVHSGPPTIAYGGAP